MTQVTHSGSCHCGLVTFEIDAPAEIVAYECNCSICERSGFLHLFVSKDEFRLLSGRDCLTSYRFNTNVAEHLFCSRCGVKSFYVPRSHPDGYSINIRCLDKSTIRAMRTERFDGTNWDENIGKLRET